MKFLEKMLKVNKMEQKFVCKYCSKKFHKEKTLITHMCVKKRRFMDFESTGPRLGFRAFQRFYELTTSSKNDKTIDDFINSDYYIAFVKFGNHLALLKPLYSDKFIDFVIKNAVPLDKWTKDHVYYAYINEIIKTEPAASATARTLEFIVKWCTDNTIEFSHFFSSIHPNEAAVFIQTGKISPWVIYLSVNGESLLKRFTDDHEKIIKDLIDASFWAKKFKKEIEEVKFIKNTLNEVGL